MPDLDTCRYCGEPITWGVNDKRQRVAVQMEVGGDLILLPPAPGDPEPRLGEHSEGVRTPAYRRHGETCTGRDKRGARRA